jgi:hypothetical protein
MAGSLEVTKVAFHPIFAIAGQPWGLDSLLGQVGQTPTEQDCWAFQCSLNASRSPDRIRVGDCGSNATFHTPPRKSPLVWLPILVAFHVHQEEQEVPSPPLAVLM